MTFVTATVFGDAPLVSQVGPTCRLLDRGEAEERAMVTMNATTMALEKNIIVECRLFLGEKHVEERLMIEKIGEKLEALVLLRC